MDVGKVDMNCLDLVRKRLKLYLERWGGDDQDWVGLLQFLTERWENLAERLRSILGAPMNDARVPKDWRGTCIDTKIKGRRLNVEIIYRG